MKNKSYLLIYCVFLFVVIEAKMNAQNGEPCFNTSYLQNPFGIEEPNVSTLVKLVDIDHDDTLEAFVTVSGPEVHYYENEGSNTAPEFVNPQTAPFGITNAAWQFADVNGDGLHELFIGHFSNDAPITMIDNTGDASTPNFQGAEEPNPYDINLPVSDDGNLLDNAFPAFVDIDDDGDYDVFITGRFINSLADEALFFIRNNDASGNGTAPQFDSIEVNPFNFNFQLTEQARLAHFADMDCDGDFDMYMNTVPSNVDYYFENKGTPEMADFSVDGNPTSAHPDPFSAAGGDFLDIGGDGDLDLINGSLNAGVQYYENSTGCICTDTQVQEKDASLALSLSPNPVKDMLQLRFSSEEILGELRLEIYDSEGRQVFVQKTGMLGNELSETLDLSHLSPGLYFLKTSLGEKLLVQKFVKQ